MGKYFGTDGFRGMAGVELTAEHSFKIGRFIGYYFKTKNNRRPKIIIGKDIFAPAVFGGICTLWERVPHPHILLTRETD